MKNTEFGSTTLSLDELEEIKNKICEKFDKLNEARRNQLSHIKFVKNAIFGSYSHNEIGAKKLNLPDAWEQAATLKAHLLEAIPSYPEGLFDVSETDNSSSERANLHKLFLCNALEKMKFQDKIEEIIDRLIETGEAILFVGWETRWRKRRSATTLYEKIQNPLMNSFKVIKEKTYEGPSLRVISSHDFVFDTQRANRWDNCPKIQRSWMEINEILENKENFTLNAQIKDELESMLERSKKDKDTTGISDGLVEVLKYFGDIRLNNGKILKNYLIVVVGRYAVVQYEPNPYVNCPYIYANIIQDPITKRGLSPLSPVIPVLDAACEIMQTQILGHKLVSNPPFLAPKGAFHGEIEVKPGKIIEYDSSLLPQMPQPLNFSAMLGGWEFIKFFKSQIERATGVFDNMAGSINESAERTATELNYTANGQNARLNWFIDSINRKIIMPLLEKTALTTANFMIGESKISTQIEGKPVTLEITPEVREGNFIYKYSDRKTTIARDSKFKEIQRTISEFSKIPDIAQKINWQECFKYTLATLGVENTSKFLLTQEEIAQKNAQNSSQTTKPANVTEGAKNEIQTP